jgi:hypothetical protein
MQKILIAVLLLIPAAAQADPAIWVNEGFLSHHFKRIGFNEKNTGFGVEVDNIAIGFYRNSLRQTSSYVAYKYQPFVAETSPAVIKAGLSIGMIDGYPDLNNSGIAPMIVPTVSIEGKRFGANFVFSPTYRRIDGFIAVQFKVKLGE